MLWLRQISEIVGMIAGLGGAAVATAEQAEVGVLAWPEVTAGLATEVNAVVAKTREPEVVWPAWAKTREWDGQMQMWYLGRWAPMEPAVTFRPWFEEGGLRVLAAASVGAVAVEVWRMERGVSWRELERPAWQGFVHRETAIAGAVVWREGAELRRAFETSVAIALAGEDPVRQDWWPQKERRLEDVIARFGFRPDAVLTWRGSGSPVRLECDLEARRVLMVTPERWGVFFLDDDAWAAVQALAVQVPEGGVPQVALVAGE